MKNVIDKNVKNKKIIQFGLLLTIPKMENFRVVQFSWNFAVGRDPRKLKSAKYVPSLSKVKAIINKPTKIRFYSSHFLYINQTKTQV